MDLTNFINQSEFRIERVVCTRSIFGYTVYFFPVILKNLLLYHIILSKITCAYILILLSDLFFTGVNKLS